MLKTLKYFPINSQPSPSLATPTYHKYFNLKNFGGQTRQRNISVVIGIVPEVAMPFFLS